MGPPKKAVVTGGAGFIGSHLAEELVKRGYRVVVLDDLSSGKLANLDKLLAGGSAEFVHGSILDLPLLAKVFSGAACVFHQAAIPSVPRSVHDPLASHEANATGTLKVLVAARDSGVKKVVYASSSSVYGDTPTLPKREDMAPAPQSPYAVSKLAGEHYCQVFHLVYGLATASLRYFNVYGPRQDPDSQYAAAIARFIGRLSQKSPPVIFGDGEQTRDFTFVADAAKANILAAESEQTGTFNVGRGERISVNRLAETVIGLMGNTVQPVHEAPRPGDIRHSLADISKAGTFGYRPEYSLERGLRETIEALGH